MPVLHINGRLVLFIHVPKTGGSSIERGLAQLGPLVLVGAAASRDLPCSPSHFHAPLLKAVMPVERVDYSFMFVRHPLDRMVSAYRYNTRKPRRWQSRLNFSSWLRVMTAMRSVRSYHRDNHLRAQHEFALDNTEVFRFEDGLEQGLRLALARVDVSTPVSLGHLKRSESKLFDIKKSDAEFVHRLYQADYQRYGYGLWPEARPALVSATAAS
jgi:hypothetical protein